MQKIKTTKTIIATVASFFLAATGTLTGLFLFSNADGIGVEAPNISNSKAYASSMSDDGSANTDSSNEAKNEEDKESEEKSTEKNEKNAENKEKSEENKKDSNENSDGSVLGAKRDEITTRDEVKEEKIAFKTETKDEVNLPRGKVKVERTGENGIRKITTRLTYKNGKLVSSEVISSVVTKEPTTQINLVGTSDFNLNNSRIQLYPNASVTRDGNTAPAFMILVNGKYYIDFWYDPVSWTRFAPASAVAVSGGKFTYSGKTYSYTTGALDSNYALSETFCKEYGLSCGRW